MVGLRWPQVAIVGLSWPELASGGLSWPELASGGLSWSELASGGLSWPQLARVGSRLGLPNPPRRVARYARRDAEPPQSRAAGTGTGRAAGDCRVHGDIHPAA